MKALVVTVPAGEAELAADALWALGVVAVEEREAGEGTEDRLVELWTSLGDDVDAITRAAEGFPARWRWQIVEVDATVADTWRRHAVPSWVEADLVVRPEWIPVDVDPGTTVISIEPGATFGLGDHPTTVLSIRALRAAVYPGATVLDVGCGSGVLSIAAARFGAGRIDAIDLSPAAVPITRHNARENGVDGLISVSTTPLAEFEGPYDVVVANILAPTLIDMADDLRRVLSASGVLIVSGVLADRHDHVETALAPLHVIARETREGWAALTLRR